MNIGERPTCLLEGRIVRCDKCKYLEFCNKMMNLEEEIKLKEMEEERRKTKCFKCVWANKIDLYCPFPKCIEER